MAVTPSDLILRAGAGYNNIDVAHNRVCGGVQYTRMQRHCSGELTPELIIAADRKIVDSTLAIKEGKWRNKGYLSADRFVWTISIIARHIGKASLEALFGMNVIKGSRRLNRRVNLSVNLRQRRYLM